MKMLRHAACVLCLILPGGLLAGTPYEPPRRSISATQQFVIYCDDLAMRLAVSSFCEDTKTGILELLNQHDQWKIPVVINIFRPDATLPGQPLSQVRLLNVEGGSKKIELNVTLRGELSNIRFQQQLVRAILLEMEYRGHPIPEDVAYIEPPQWLIEGLSTYLRNRTTDMDVEVYKTLLKNNALPSITDFLSQDTSGMNAASMKLYQAYAFSFLQLLTSLQGGPTGLGAYIRDLPIGQDAPTVDLVKHFQALGGSTDSLEKWWTLSMARLSASDRYEGLSLQETDQRLTALLQFTIPIKKQDGKKGEKEIKPGDKPVEKPDETKVFSINDYKQFIKIPEERPVLAKSSALLQSFATEANPLFRPIILEYQLLIDELKMGKVKHTDERLANIAKYKGMILNRMEQITDYMNWFEATQIVNRSNSFEDYLKTAQQESGDAPKRDDAISRYMESLEMQMQ